MSSSSVIVASSSVPPSLQSFWGQRTAARRTHLPRPLWTSLQRATAHPEVILTSLYNQSFEEWGAKEQRKYAAISLCWHARIKTFIITSFSVGAFHLTGNTNALMSTESCHCWPTWVSCSLLTLDQLDLYTASPRTRYMRIWCCSCIPDRSFFLLLLPRKIVARI